MVIFVLNNILDRTSLLKMADLGWWTDTFKNLCKGLGEFTSVCSYTVLYHLRVADLKMPSLDLNREA